MSLPLVPEPRIRGILTFNIRNISISTAVSDRVRKITVINIESA